MNSTIKRVVISVALLQTVCSQAFTEFVNVNELAGRVTEQVVQETPKGYMEMACDLWSRRPSMPSMPSISIPKISMPSISLPKVSMPSFSMPSMPVSVTSGYESAKTFATPYVTSVVNVVAPHITLQNGKYATIGVAVLAGLYAGYKVATKNKSVVPAEISLKENMINAIVNNNEQYALELVEDDEQLKTMVQDYFIALNGQEDANKASSCKC